MWKRKYFESVLIGYQLHLGKANISNPSYFVEISMYFCPIDQHHPENYVILGKKGRNSVCIMVIKKLIPDSCLSCPRPIFLRFRGIKMFIKFQRIHIFVSVSFRVWLSVSEKVARNLPHKEYFESVVIR